MEPSAEIRNERSVLNQAQQIEISAYICILKYRTSTMPLQEDLKSQGEFLFKYRSYLPIILLLLAIGLKVYRAKSGIDLPSDLEVATYWFSSISLGILGIVIRIWTVGYTPGNTSGRNTKEGQVADLLNTTGIYSIMRNPLYLGNYLMWVSIALLSYHIWFVLLFTGLFWIYYERIVYVEEVFLREKFGNEYLKWSNATPVFLPMHFKYIRSDIPFSWRKVVKKEKNGFFALFLLFWVFDALGSYLETGLIPTWDSWTFVCAIIAGCIYFILKLVKMYTSLLHEEGR